METLPCGFPPCFGRVTVAPVEPNEPALAPWRPSRRPSAACDVHLFLAMAHCRLEEMDVARGYLDEAVRWFEANKPTDPQLRRFRAEAETLLKSDESSTPKE